MIRPLEYCENSDHLKDSLQTIEQRIAELIDLHHAYQAKAIALGLEVPTTAYTLATKLKHAQ